MSLSLKQAWVDSGSIRIGPQDACDFNGRVAQPGHSTNATAPEERSKVPLKLRCRGA